MENLKDTVTTICGVLFVGCGAIVGVQTQVALPKWLLTAATVVGAISVAVTMYLTGKTPAGLTKSPAQVAAENSEPQ